MWKERERVERKGEEERVRKKEREKVDLKTPFSDSTPDQIKIGLRTLYYLRGREKSRKKRREKLIKRGERN